MPLINVTRTTSYIITQVATLRREKLLIDLHEQFVFVAELFASAMGYVRWRHDLATSQELYVLPEIQEKIIMLMQSMYLIREKQRNHILFW